MRKYAVLFVVILFFLAFFSAEGDGRQAVVKALGMYDFEHYYDYEELENFLKDMHESFPLLTEVKSLCKSLMGRDVWMLVINNPETGEPDEKPGFFLNQIHSSEVIASMSCVYTIWHLLENYGKDNSVTELVDNLVWYIVPRLDVDGAEAYLTGKPAGVDPHPIDSDGDRLFDEDSPEDIDGDGHIVQMRQIDPEGEMKASEKDPRILARKAADEKGGTYYKIYSEGLDNDGDGRINEDSFRTRFLSNRNYPGNWKPQTVQGGGGRYPMEETITRAEVDFMADHPNIAIYVQHHCCGRVILRPPTTMPDSAFENKKDLEVYRIASARSLEFSGWDLATSVFDWNYPPGTGNKKSTQIYRDKEGKIRNAPSGMYPEGSSPAFSADFCPCDDDFLFDRGYYAWGSSLETAYDLFGIFSMGDEHWNMPDYDKDGTVTEEERLKWNDEEMGGKMFVPWHPFDHPTLGEVEIGGWLRHKASPPEGELILKECEMGNRYTIYLAGLAPRVSISEPQITDKKGGVFQVDLAVENTGFLPTSTEQAQSLGLDDFVLLEVEPNDNLEILYGEKTNKIGYIEGYSKSPQTTFIMRINDVAVEALLKVTARSKKAGIDTREIVIK
jgi:hypothetical protein